MNQANTSTNRVQIAVEAQDKASETLKAVRSQFDGVSESVAAAQAQTVALTAAFAALGASTTQSLGGATTQVISLTTAIQNLYTFTKDVATYDVGGQSFWGLVTKQAENAMTKTAKLSEVMKATRSLTADFAMGVSTGKLKDDPLKGLEGKFEAAAKKITDKLLKTFNEIPIDQIPIIGQLLNADQMPMLAGMLDNTLSGVIFDRILKGKLPNVLKSVLGDGVVNTITSGVGNLFKQTPLKFFLSDHGKQLAEGSVLNAFEKQFTNILTRAFSKAFVTVDSLVSGVAKNFGFLTGQALTGQSDGSGFANLNNALEGRVGDRTGAIGKDVAQSVTEGIDFDNLAKEIGKGFITGFATGNALEIPLKFIFPAPVVSFLTASPLGQAAEAFVKSLDLQIFDAVGNAIAKGLNLGPQLRNVFQSTLGAVVTGALEGGIAAGMGALQPYFEKFIPESFRDMFLTFGQEMGVTLLDAIESPIEQTQRRIRELEQSSQQLRQVQGDQTIEQLQASTPTYDPGVSLEEIEAMENRLNQRIEAAQRATEQESEIESLRLTLERLVSMGDTGLSSGDSFIRKLGLDKFFSTPIQRAQQEIDSIQENIEAIRDRTGGASIDELMENARNITQRTDLTPEEQNAQFDSNRFNIELARWEELQRIRIEELNTEIANVQDRPDQLEERRLAASVDPTLSEEDRALFVEQYEQMIEQAARDIDMSPFEQLAQKINEVLFSWLGEEFSENIIENLGNTLGKVDEFFDGAFSDIFAVIGSNAAVSFSNGLGEGIIEGLAPIIDQVDSFMTSTIETIQEIPGKFIQPIEGAGNLAGYLAGLSDPISLFTNIQDGASQAFEAIAQVGQQLTFFQSGFDTLRSVVMGGPFELLIGQNITLKEQLLSTQSSLVGTSKIIDKMTGQAIVDPAAAIAAVQVPVEAALEKIRMGSLELVGVTSNQLVDVFDIIASQASSIGLSLSDAADLTLSTAASLGTLGVPLAQSRQEISSILMGTIDMNSVLAKSLNITNQQVNSWKQQGRLMQELTKRLEAFRAGNKMAAMSIGGVTSNIQEIIETVGRKAGGKLLDPIVKEIADFYDYLNANLDNITEFVTEVVGNVFDGLFTAFTALKNAFKPLEGLFVSIPRYLSQSLANALTAFAKALEGTMQILDPFISTAVALFDTVRPLGGPLIELAVKARLLTGGIGILGNSFGMLKDLVPVVGEVMFGMNMRMLPLVNLIPNLTQQTGSLGVAGFLTLGKHMADIPGLAGFITNALGPIGPLVVGLVPMIAGVGIQLVGLTKIFPQLEGVMQGLLSQNPGELVKKLGQLVGMVPGMGFLANAIDGAGDSLRIMAGNMNVAEFATAKFKEVARLAGIQLRNFVVNTALLGVALFALFKAFDHFILKNQELLDALGAIVDGLGEFWNMLIELTPALLPIAGVIAGITVSIFGLHTALLTLIATQIAGWFTNLGDTLTGIGKFLKLLNLTDMAKGAKSAAIGFNIMAISMTQGSVAAAQYAASNGVNIITLQGLQAQTTATIATTEAFIVTMIRAAFTMVGKFVSAVIKAGVALLKFLVTSLWAATKATLGFLINLPRLILGLIGSANAAIVAQGGLLAFARSLWTATAGAVAAAIAFLKTKLMMEITIPSLFAGSAGFGVLATSIWTVVSGLIALAAPIALVVAALAAIGMVVYTNKMERATEETNNLATETGNLSSKATELRQKIKNAQEAQEEKAKKGVILTKEEIAANQDLLSQARLQEKSIEEQIKLLEERLDKEKNKTNQSRLKQQIDELNKELTKLRETSKDVTIVPPDLARQGSVYEQLRDKVNAAMTAIKQGGGDSATFAQKGQELIDLTNQQLQLGFVTAKEAVNLFRLVSNNALASQELQLKAQEAITAAYKNESDRRIKITEQAISEIDVLVQEGEISAIEGEKRTTKEKIKLSELRIEQIKKERDEKQKSFELELKNTLSEIERRRADLEKSMQVAKGQVVDPQIKQAIADGSQRLEAVDAQIAQTQERLAKAEKFSKTRGGNSKDLKKAQEELDILMYRRNLIQSAVKNAENQVNQTPTANPEQIKAVKEQLDGLAQEERAAREAIAGMQKQYNDQTEQEEKTHQNAIRTEKAKQLKAERDNALKDLDDKQAILEESFRKRELAETEYQSKSEALKKERIDLEISQLTQDLNSLEKTDTQGRSRILAQIAKLNTEKLNVDKEASDRQKALRVEDYEEELKLIQAQFAQGEITREQLNQKTRDNRLAQAEEQRKQLEESLEKLKDTDKEGREKIIAQLEELEVKKSEILGTYQDQEFTRISEATDKAIKAVEEVETQRLIELQKLYNQGIVLNEEFEEEKLKASLKRIKKEIEEEKKKLAELSRLPVSSNPEQEKKRQEAIANSRRGLMQMSLRMLQTEDSLQQAHLAKLRRAIELANLAIANQVERQNQALERQSRLYEAQSKALDNRSKLLSAQKELMEAGSNFLLTSIDSVSKLEKSDIRRQKLAEATAAIKLKALEQQIEMERQSLELQHKQNELAAEREIMQARIAEGQAKLNAMKVEGEVKVKLLDKKLPKEEKEQLELQLEVARDQAAFARENVDLARQGLSLVKETNEIGQEVFYRNSQARMQTARVEAIQSLPENSVTRRQWERAEANRIAQESGFPDVATMAQAGRNAGRNEIARSLQGNPGAPTTMMPMGQGAPGIGGGRLGGGQAGTGLGQALLPGFGGTGQGGFTIPRMPNDINGTLAAFDPNLAELAPYLNERQRSRYQMQLSQEYGLKYGLTGMGLTPEPAQLPPDTYFPGISGGQQGQVQEEGEIDVVGDGVYVPTPEQMKQITERNKREQGGGSSSSDYEREQEEIRRKWEASGPESELEVAGDGVYVPTPEQMKQITERNKREQRGGSLSGGGDRNTATGDRIIDGDKSDPRDSQLSRYDDGSGITVGQFREMSAAQKNKLLDKYESVHGIDRNMSQFATRSSQGSSPPTGQQSGSSLPASQSARIPSMNMPSPDTKAFTGGTSLLEKASSLFESAVDKFAKVVDSITGGKGKGSAQITMNNNVNITASSNETGNRMREEVLKQFDRITRLAETM